MIQFPQLTDQQAKFLWVLAYEDLGYIHDVIHSYKDIYDIPDGAFDPNLLLSLEKMKLLEGKDGEYYDLTLLGIASLTLYETKQSFSKAFPVERYFQDIGAGSTAQLIKYLSGGWCPLRQLEDEAWNKLTVLCTGPLIWELLPQLELQKQRDLTMFSWYSMQLFCPHAELTQLALSRLKKISSANSMPTIEDELLLGTRPMMTDDPFLLPYSESSLAKLWPKSRLNNPKASFKTLLDLAALSIHCPDWVDQIIAKLITKLPRAGLCDETSQIWYQAFAMVNASAEELEQQLGEPQAWLSRLNAEHFTSWGAALLQLLTIFRLFSLKPELHRAVLPELQQSKWLKDLQQSPAEFPMAQKVKAGVEQLLDPEVKRFCIHSNPIENWFGRLQRTLEMEAEAQERIVWQLAPDLDTLELKIQKRSKKGWSKGRSINLGELEWKYQGLATEKDLQLAYYLGQNYYRYHSGAVELNKAAIRLLAQSERVIDSSGDPVSIYVEKPLVVISAQEEQLLLSTYPEHREELIYQKPGGILAFLEIAEQLEQFFTLFHEFPNGVPVSELAALEQVLEGIPDLNWYSETREHGSIELQPWSETPSIWLHWTDLKLEISIEHQPESSRLVHLSQPSGQGDTWLSVPSNAGIWFKRDLKKELASSLALSKSLELPNSRKRHWSLDFTKALELLERLQQQPELSVHWRGGQQVRMLTEQSLKLEVKQQQNWFVVEGSASIDKDLELELRSLLASSHNRYRELEDGSVLLISESLKRQLRLLDSVLDEEQQVDARMAYPLAQLIGSMSHSGDQGWKALTDKWREKPVLDESLLSPLRDYQKESVLWAAHLAHHQFGACLADDMGLGKTLQALTLLRHFANEGPALVVAPKSVLHNWQLEAERFAPELNIIELEHSQQRQQAIEQAQAGDVLLLSYGLLTRQADELETKEWQAIVLDEAQNIKNPSTKRAKLIFQLNGKHRFALTGTPVENHLLELWSLFHFINPGLLGGKTQFVKTYGKAAQNEEDMARLKTLVSPFIMRRLKRDVLTELPAKTEITHEIELSKAERTAYEAVRKQVLADVKSGKGLVEVLSGMTRLRQVCCDPRLVFEQFKEPGSKLTEALELVQEALESNHKILIFSQFVKVLKGFAELLDRAALSYSYLDGQCSTKQRKQAIADFKEGNHSLFLISLKAGGTGLNLTEADMVIHLDPWWNPAVEDQASDRAHRMGQTKPVTVYRLVAEDSIEQKIIQLHEEKRELADKLLDGQGESKGLSPEMLVGLLTDG